MTKKEQLAKILDDLDEALGKLQSVETARKSEAIHLKTIAVSFNLQSEESELATEAVREANRKVLKLFQEEK